MSKLILTLLALMVNDTSIKSKTFDKINKKKNKKLLTKDIKYEIIIM